jgi:hypothetical protein
MNMLLFRKNAVINFLYILYSKYKKLSCLLNKMTLITKFLLKFWIPYLTNNIIPHNTLLWTKNISMIITKRSRILQRTVHL